MLYLYVRLMMLGFSFNTVLLHLVSVLFWTSTECGWLTAEIVFFACILAVDLVAIFNTVELKTVDMCAETGTHVTDDSPVDKG